MSLSSLVEHYGYAAVFVGALVEGETLLLVAGYAAHRGLLKLPEVMLAAFVAGTLGDQLLFWLGRRHGARLFARFPALAGHTQRVQDLLARHPNAAIVSVRFLYGLRVAGPAVLGALGVPPRKFVLLNLLGAALWAGAFGAIGYQFGYAMQWLLADLRLFEEGALLAVLLAGLAWALWRWWRKRSSQTRG
jgi:membrane protein DedA with SNARE-associated domain